MTHSANGFILTTFDTICDFRVWFITEQSHSNMESMLHMQDSFSIFTYRMFSIEYRYSSVNIEQKYVYNLWQFIRCL